MTHEEYCALLGDKDVRIYELNTAVAGLSGRVATLDKELAEREAIIQKLSQQIKPEPTPSLSKMDEPYG